MDAVIINTILFRRQRRRKQRKCRLWIHEINRKRPDFGMFHHLHPDLQNDEKKFYSFFSDELGNVFNTARFGGT